jgi:hypothetical protein
MSALAWARREAAKERPLGPLGLGLCAAVCVAAAIVAAAMPEGSAARWFLAAVLAAVLAFVCLRSTTQGVLITFVWLFALGTSRRLASEVLADPGRDPFVLVGPAAVAVLALRALLVGALRRMTILSWLLLAFTALAVVQMANPDNPSGFSRVAGLLVWVAPTLWFWVGRTLVGDRIARWLLYLVVSATTVIALYGIVQTVVDFPPWDQRWINLRGYAALYIGPDTVRPFGSYASAAEFGLACAVGAIVAATIAFGPRLLLREPSNRRAERRQRSTRVRIVVLAVVLFGITSVALVLSAIRTYLVLLAVALPIVYLVMRGKRAWKVLIPALLIVGLALAALSQIDPDSIGKEGAQAGVRRVIVALHDPFAQNRENTDNTLQLHWENAKFGVRRAFEHPQGYGTGATGIAGEHFGDQSFSTDFDLSDAGLAFGALGFLLAVAIVVVGLWFAVRVALWRRTFERVALVGVLLVSFGAWFQGAHYVMAPLLWLLLGRADRLVAGRRPDRDECREPTHDDGADDDLATLGDADALPAVAGR